MGLKGRAHPIGGLTPNAPVRHRIAGRERVVPRTAPSFAWRSKRADLAVRAERVRTMIRTLCGAPA